MAFNASTGAYTAASGATSAAAGNIIASATWNSIFTDLQTALTQLGQGTFAPPTTTLTLVNGLNSNITLTATLRAIVSGPTGAFSIGGFTGGADGKRLYIFNNISQTMTVVNEDTSSTAANRIKTLTGSNLVLTGTSTSFVTLSYDGTVSRWVVESINGVHPNQAAPSGGSVANIKVYAIAVPISTTADTQITIPLPVSVSNYAVTDLRLANSVGTTTNTTVGLYTAANQGGTVIITSTALTIASSLAGAANSHQVIVPASANTVMFNSTPLFFCVVHNNGGTAASVDAIITLQPLY